MNEENLCTVAMCTTKFISPNKKKKKKLHLSALTVAGIYVLHYIARALKTLT